MTKPTKKAHRAITAAGLSRRARLISGISAIAAIGVCPSVSHARTVDFAAMADTVLSM